MDDSHHISDIPQDIKYSTKIEGWGFETVDGKRTVIYTIIILASNGASWCVRRRYSEFRDNWLTISNTFPRSKVAAFNFPGKTVFANAASGDDRKKELQKYLNHLLLIHPVPLEVLYFLRITPKVLGITPEGGSPTPYNDNAGDDDSDSSGGSFSDEDQIANNMQAARNFNPKIEAEYRDTAWRESTAESPNIGNSPVIDGRVASKHARIIPSDDEDEILMDFNTDASGDDLDKRLITPRGARGGGGLTQAPTNREPSGGSGNNDDAKEEPEARAARKKERMERKMRKGKSRAAKHAAHSPNHDYAKNELDQLSDEESPSEESSSCTSNDELRTTEFLSPLEIKNAKRMMAIRRHVKRRVKGHSKHTTKVMRPYTMAHHNALLDALEEDDEGDMSHMWEGQDRVEAFVVFVVYGSLICALKVAVNWLAHYIDNTQCNMVWQWGGLLSFTGIYNLLLGIVNFFRQYVWGLWVANNVGLSWVIKTTIFLVLVMSTAHRIIGFVLGEWLYGLIGTEKGAFRMTFGAVIIRLGLIYNDSNEILIKDFVWHNIKPKFNQTPYFAKINTLRIKFDLISIIDAIKHRSPIKLHEFVIDGLTVHIERGQRQADGLNLWAVLGAEDEEESLAVKDGVLSKLAGAALGSGKAMGDLGKGMWDGMGRGVRGVGQMGGKMVGGVVTVFDPKTGKRETVEEIEIENEVDRLNSEVVMDSANKIQAACEADEEVDFGDENGTRQSVKDNVANIFGSIRENLIFDNDSTDEESGIEYDESDSEEENEKTVEGTDALAFKDVDEVRRRERMIKNTKTLIRMEQKAKGLDPDSLPELESHWGIPYKFECTRFTARTLRFYVKDYLAARHTKHAPIKIGLIEMSSKELEEYYFSQSQSVASLAARKKWPKGLFLDDLTWRIINRLIGDLLKTNAFSLLGTVGASGLNQTKEAVIGTGKYAANKTVQSLYNYNPKELAHGAMNGIRWVTHMSAPKLARSPSVQDLQISKLKVDVIAVRGLTLEGIEMTSTVVAKVELRNQPGHNGKHYQRKTHNCTPSDERDVDGRLVYRFDASMELPNLTSMNSELYVRVFQSSVLKDRNIAEIHLPIRDDVSHVVDQVTGRVIKENKPLMPWEDEAASSHFVTILPGIREDKSGWYLLYSPGSDNICGEVYLTMGLY